MVGLQCLWDQHAGVRGGCCLELHSPKATEIDSWTLTRSFYSISRMSVSTDTDCMGEARKGCTEPRVCLGEKSADLLLGAGGGLKLCGLLLPAPTPGTGGLEEHSFPLFLRGRAFPSSWAHQGVAGLLTEPSWTGSLPMSMSFVAH